MTTDSTEAVVPVEPIPDTQPKSQPEDQKSSEPITDESFDDVSLDDAKPKSDVAEATEPQPKETEEQDPTPSTESREETSTPVPSIAVVTETPEDVPSTPSNNNEDDDVANDNLTVSPTRTGRRSKRSPSLALSVSSITATGQHVISSDVFIKKALKAIKAHKSTSKVPALDGSVTKALNIFDAGELPPPAVVFEPLRLVCSQTSNIELKVIALDCIGKLFTFSYLVDTSQEQPPAEAGITPPPKVPLLDRAIKTVCDCFQNESTDSKVELQIIKALMAAVLNDDLIAHGATLLRAIRQTYTIFVLSHSPTNQTIAQATLSQMITVIFERLKSVLKSSNRSITNDSSTFSIPFDANAESSTNGSVPETPTTQSNGKLTLKQMENLGSSSDVERFKEEVPTTDEDENDLFAKDAFLVFRTLCRLSEKTLEGDSLDVRSHSMRSKLLSLHLIYNVLNSHMSIFLSNEIIIHSNLKGSETFLLSVKDYICSTLARNAASINPAVFEISSEIFFLIVSNLRSQFKKEIEVFFAEIYFPITEMKTSTYHQKQYLLSIVQRICNDPRALVEIYLNYDCDANSTLNIYEQLIDFLVKLAVTPVSLTSLQLQMYQESKGKSIAQYNLSLTPALAIMNFQNYTAAADNTQFPIEHALKMTALESFVAVLRSLLTWSQRGIAAVSASLNKSTGESDKTIEESSEANDSKSVLSVTTGSSTVVSDDPSQFQSLKIKKTALQEAIRQFNIKPKKGIKNLLSSGLIESDSPKDIAQFLLTTEGLDKALLGEYLGEGDAENIAIMHAFVDLMDFSNMRFVDALRKFLQAFRLPGESQKIDRYMLKFAERYTLGNPKVFANADTAYVLAYSVIMLNTDLHSPQVKNRMTLDDFYRNNRGIDDNQDLPKEYLEEIYNEIRDNEIKLLSEQHAALLSSDGQQAATGFAANLSSVLATVGRDLQREAYMQASKEMSNKTEQLFKSLISRDNKKTQESIFYIASHFEHVKPMFEVVWMSLLAGLSGPFQESDDPAVIKLCLEGFKLSIRIACLFEIDLARISFVSALAQFTNLQNLSEMKQKNVDAIKQLLTTALSEGNLLKSSWKEVLTCISQLERFQLIAQGIEAGAIPDVTNARFASRKTSTDTVNSKATGGFFSRPRHSTQSSSNYSHNNMNGHELSYSPELAEELQSREISLNMDKIFTNSALLSGDAIVDFVRALTEVSAEEIQSSGQSEHPRTFSLQKMVDICYYNMERIRFEWSRLWAIMGKQFNIVGCHENTNVVFFALDSLRQLSIRFFDLEELSHFKFQKEFLEPFAYVMGHNDNSAVKDMVLQCLQQMVLAKSEKIRSGWKTMFATFSISARQPYANVVNTTFDIVKRIQEGNLEQVIAQDSFGNMVNCFSELAKNQRFQKPSLHSVEILKDTISKILKMKDDFDSQNTEVGSEFYTKYWFPVLFALHDIIMNGEDLEVRSRALNYMFDALTTHGDSFDTEFWDTICRKLLFPTFVVLKSRSEMARFNTQDDMSVWLSTTMIQALRNMIALLTHYFDTLGHMLDGFLELLTTCINQENDTVSRIGSSCLQQLIQENVEKFEDHHWSAVVDTIQHLFELTTASELFGDYSDLDESLNDQGKDIANGTSENYKGHRPTASVASTTSTSGKEAALTGQEISGPKRQFSTDYNHTRQKRFRKTIVKCILQLLMIDTVDDILQKQETIDADREPNTNGPPSAMVIRRQTKVSGTEIYEKIPVGHLLRILVLLRKSFIFAHRFNNNKELRTNLWRLGFMKQLPNLLKQETLSAHVYISVLFRLFNDHEKLYPESATGNEKLDKPIVVEKYDIDYPSKIVEREAEAQKHGNKSDDPAEPKEYITITTQSELKAYLSKELMPMMAQLLAIYDRLEPNDARANQAWTPVVFCILEGLIALPRVEFSDVIEDLYPGILGIMNRDMSPSLRIALQGTLKRVGQVIFKKGK